MDGGFPVLCFIHLDLSELSFWSSMKIWVLAVQWSWIKLEVHCGMVLISGKTKK